MWNILQFLLPQKCLGVDIGTAYVKIAEISRFGNRRKLENYGSLSANVLYEKPFRTFEKNTLLLSSGDIGKAIRAIIAESKMTAKQAVFSIPDFSTFFTNFQLPPMTRQEIPDAIKYEAKQHIPFPLGEMTLDWRVIDGKLSDKKEEKLKVLLVAVPNEVINQYRTIAQLSGLELFALEAEVFGLIRSLVGEDEKEPIGLIDIGAQSTTCSIVEKKNLVTSHSFNMSGNELTVALSKSLNMDYKEAEKLKRKYGIEPHQEEDGINKDFKAVLAPLVDMIVREAEKIFSDFTYKERKELKRVILAGGSALLPGLKEYLEGALKKEIAIAEPFSSMFYPPILEKTLKRMGPGYAIAVGSALRGLEY